MATSIKHSLDNATIGVITVLKEEYAAAVEILNCTESLTSDGGRFYKIGAIPRSDNTGNHIVALCRLSGQGNETAAVRTSSLIEDCKNLQVIIMCGIAGAVPSPEDAENHVRLGDIVVSGNEGVLQYDLEKVEEESTEIRAKPLSRVSRRMLEVYQSIEGDELRGKRPWDKYIKQAITQLNSYGSIDWSRPEDTEDILRKQIEGSENWEVIAHPNDDQRKDGLPRLFCGVIASANKLVKKTSLRDMLKEKYKAKAIEMEAAGIAHAAIDKGKDFFIVRGTCDYCNNDKNDSWHYYASVISAAFIKVLIENLGVSLSEGTNISGTHKNETQVGANANLGDIKLVERDCEHIINRIDEYINTFEINKCKSISKELENILTRYELEMDRELVLKAYYAIARIAVRIAQETGIKTDIEKAQYFIGKAKSVKK